MAEYMVGLVLVWGRCGVSVGGWVSFAQMHFSTDSCAVLLWFVVRAQSFWTRAEPVHIVFA